MRATIDWYRWLLLNRSSRNVGLTYHPFYWERGNTINEYDSAEGIHVMRGMGRPCCAGSWCANFLLSPKREEWAAGHLPGESGKGG